jgi:hypothetical protein
LGGARNLSRICDNFLTVKLTVKHTLVFVSYGPPAVQ